MTVTRWRVGLLAVCVLFTVTHLSGQTGPPVSILQGGNIATVDGTGALKVAATIAGGGDASAANQTSGAQKTQIVDGAGNVIGSTSNALDINIKSGNPTTIAVTQATATSLKAQAEAYQGGAAVGAANPLQVTLANGSVPSHAVTNAGTFAVQATQTTSPWIVAGGGTAGTAASGVATIQGIASMTPVQVSQATASNLNATVVGTGTFATQAAQSGTWTVQPGNTANTTAWLVSIVPATSGGSTPCYGSSAASTNATNCKASAGQIYGYDLLNTTTTVYYLRLYNLSSSPTCSSATGYIRSIPVPPAAASGGVGGLVRDIANGEAYGTGISFCLTGGGSSTDNTNAATGVYVTIQYK